MPKRAKKYKEALKQFNAGELYSIEEAIEIVKRVAYAKFDETLEAHIKLGIDPRKSDQTVRGTTVLPHGTGKTPRVIVFTKGDKISQAEEAGAELTLSPWWGPDPLSTQVGLELYGHAAAWRTPDSTATNDYARARAVLRIAFPLADARWRVGLEAGAGTTWGDAPLQRSWFLGGPLNLRGYSASTMAGPSFTRVRLEVARVFAFYATTVTAFGDAGWAGMREDFHTDDLLYGVGLGASVLDGLIRMDLSQGLRGPGKQFRVDLYLDAIL